VEVEGPVAGYGPSRVLCHCHWQPREVRSRRLTVVLVHGLDGIVELAVHRGQYSARARGRAQCGAHEHAFLRRARMIFRRRLSLWAIGANMGRVGRRHHSRAAAGGRGAGRLLDGRESGAALGGRSGGEPAARTESCVVGVSPLMDLAASSAALHRPQNRLYERHFFAVDDRRGTAADDDVPQDYADAALDRIHTMRQFDHHIVARYGGFADADDYYYSVASSHYAGSLRSRR